MTAIPGSDSSTFRLSGAKLTGANRSWMSGVLSPSRLRLNTIAVVAPKVSAPLPRNTQRRTSGTTRGNRASSLKVIAFFTRWTMRVV